MPMKKLILATSNPGKLAEIGEYLTDIDLELPKRLEAKGVEFAAAPPPMLYPC